MTELGDKNNGIKAKSKPSVCSDILRTPTNDCPAVNKTWTVFPLVFKGLINSHSYCFSWCCGL